MICFIISTLNEVCRFLIILTSYVFIVVTIIKMLQPAESKKPSPPVPPVWLHHHLPWGHPSSLLCPQLQKLMAFHQCSHCAFHSSDLHAKFPINSLRNDDVKETIRKLANRNVFSPNVILSEKRARGKHFLKCALYSVLVVITFFFKCVLICSFVSSSLWPHGMQPTTLLCPWGISSQEYWSGLSCPPPGNLPNPGMEPMSPTVHVNSSVTEPQWDTIFWENYIYIYIYIYTHIWYLSYKYNVIFKLHCSFKISSSV